MANWPVLRAAWVDLTELAAIELQKIDTFLTKVPNFMDGSSHNSATQVILGGAGLQLQGSTALQVTGFATYSNGAKETFQSGATLQANAGSNVNINGQLTANGASWDLINETSVVMVTGTFLTVGGTFNLTGTSTFSGFITYASTFIGAYQSGAEAEFLSGSFIIMNGGSSITIASSASIVVGGAINVHSGGNVDIAVGANITVEGDVAIENGGTLTVHNGGDFNVQSGGAANINNGASLNVSSSGTANISGVTTISGPTQFSGNNGRIEWRAIGFDGASGRPNGDANATFDVWKWDYIVMATFTNNRTWRMTAPPAGAQNRVRISNLDSSGGNITIKDDGNGNTLGIIVSGNAMEFVYANGSNGIPVGWTSAGA